MLNLYFTDFPIVNNVFDRQYACVSVGDSYERKIALGIRDVRTPAAWIKLTSQKMSIKMLYCTATIHLLKRCMACSSILKIAPDSHVRLAGGIISEPSILEHVQRKMARCAKIQTLFVQRSLSDVDSVRARKILSMQMAVLPFSCYTQSLNNRIFIVNDFFI